MMRCLLAFYSAARSSIQPSNHQTQPPGTRPEKLRIQKWYNIYKDHITLADYEIHDGMNLELYYN